MLNFFRNISGPVTMHLELTEACPEKCRHCYNFVRSKDYQPKTITRENIDFYLDEFKAVNGFHVILTGGEPLVVFDKLMYAIEGAKKRGFSYSLNSNMMLAKPDKMKALYEAGLDHILTTLFSYDPETHDFIASRKGAHSEIIEGIQTALEAGIRISVNMIVTNVNDRHVYKTGEFVYKKLGINKFLANRMIPSTTNSESLKEEFLVKSEAAKRMLDDLMRLKQDYGMVVSTCRALPHCFLGDLRELYAFTARGCNGGKRHILLDVDGSARACVHEADSYGNIHEVGIKGVWEKMSKWRDISFIPEECQKCSVVNICEGGCRQIAEVVYGDWKARDNLCKGVNNLIQGDHALPDEVIAKLNQMEFFVNPEIEFRDERDAILIRIFAGKCVLVERHFGEFLIHAKQSGCRFRFHEFPMQSVNEMEQCLIYDIVRADMENTDFAILLEQYRN